MKPLLIQNLLAEALALHRAGRLTDAGARYARVLAAAPRHFDALHLAGVVALQEGRAADAASLLSRAHAVQPSESLCTMRLALAHSALGRNEEAETRLRRLVEKHPAMTEAWDNLGLIQQLRGRLTEALASFRRAVEISPDYAQGWCNLGLALLFADQPEEALTALGRAESAAPGLGAATRGRAMALQHLHRIPEAVATYGTAIARNPADFESRSYRLLALHYLDGISRDQLFQEHRVYGAAASASAGAAPPAPTVSRPGRRLKVAFLSPDLRTHSVAYFLEPLLRHLDREAFAITLYHDHFQVDAASLRLCSLAAVWRNFAGQPAAVVAAQIAADAPDILVDLAGHTGLNRLPLFARRLAPVQVSYLGYPDTTGLAEMDFRLVDQVTDPFGEAEPYSVETLIRFAPTAWAYQPPADAPEPGEPEGGGVTFGSCNNLAKTSDSTLAAWSRLLRAVPNSRLLLKAAGLEQANVQTWLRGRLAAAQIDPGRVISLGRTAETAYHLETYRRIDIALDTYPYHGTTTTCEALWMGVPVVSLAGDRHAARVGASLLEAIGRPEWVAHSWADYERIAADLARARPHRRDLRRQMAESVLLDHAGQAARFGAALRQCWERKEQGAVAAADWGTVLA